ncbi:hypothetical protein CLF_105205 [Clonorchis sinensis]|uniref:Uncharacterized protein n=1 Tax=Clonorchis sinensis TaxID=79923 RepID=G7YD72_CLOSI|nr:hypothetical protein CLF_105205 [Clonorchis sinensis]
MTDNFQLDGIRATGIGCHIMQSLQLRVEMLLIRSYSLSVMRTVTRLGVPIQGPSRETVVTSAAEFAEQTAQLIEHKYFVLLISYHPDRRDKYGMSRMLRFRTLLNRTDFELFDDKQSLFAIRFTVQNGSVWNLVIIVIIRLLGASSRKPPSANVIRAIELSVEGRVNQATVTAGLERRLREIVVDRYQRRSCCQLLSRLSGWAFGGVGLRSLNRRSNSFLNSPNSTYTLLTRHTNECETEDEEDGDHVCFERFDQLDPISEDLQSISTYQEIIDSVHSTSNTTQNLRSPLQACSVNEYETVTVRKRRQDFIAEDTELSKIKNLFSFEGTEDMRSPNSLWKDRLDGTNIIHTAISLKEGGRASGTSSSFIPHQAEDSERRFQSRNFATKSDTVLEKENKQPQNVFGQCQKPSVTRNERNEELITSRKATIHRPMVNRQVKVVSHHLENQHSPNNHNRKSLRCENDGRVPRTPSSPQCSSETVLSTDSTGRFAFSTTPMEMDWNTE